MKIFRKNKYGASSPLEFSIASMALISTIVVVTVSMSPPVEQSAAQFYADANAKATEIMSLVLSSKSEVGLAIDPGTSVPIPDAQAITEMTIENSRPQVYEINPYDDGKSTPYPWPGNQVPEGPITLSVVVIDPDGDDMNVTFFGFLSGDPDTVIHESTDKGVSSGERANSTVWVLDPDVNYEWRVNVTDQKDNLTSSLWDFRTSAAAPPNQPPDPPIIQLVSSEEPGGYPSGTELTFSATTTDPDCGGNDGDPGERVIYYWDFDALEGEHPAEPYYSDGLLYPACQEHFCEVTHPFDNFDREPVTYWVYAIARDDEGAESAPSEPFPITINPKDTLDGDGRCFLKDTKVIMADNSQKNIQDIEVGDMIKSYDEKTKLIKNDIVTNIFHDSPDQLLYDYYLMINGQLKITPDHPIYVDGKWIEARDLQVGDQLYIGKVGTIEKIYDKVPTYNFETGLYHNYFVAFGKSIAIAHNTRKYILNGNEETVSLSRQTSVTEYDYSALLSLDKVYDFASIDYEDAKKMIKIPNYYEFYISISNSESVFLDYKPVNENVKDTASTVVTQRENVIVVDDVGYAYATITVTVVK